MANLVVAVFEILSFGAIVVLVVLGLGVIASMMGIFNFAQGEFVLLGAYVTYIVHTAGLPVWLGMVAAPFVVGALGFVLERLIVRRFYAAPIVAMLGTYALGLIIREVVRTLIGGPLPIGARADRRIARRGDNAFLLMAPCDRHHYGPGHGGKLSSALPYDVWPADPGLSGESVARPRLRDFHQRDLWRDLRVWRRPGWPCRCADRAGVFVIRRSWHSLPDSGIRRGHGWRRRVARQVDRQGDGA